MTAELPWTSVGVATGYRGNRRVFTASATAHGTSTANATLVATARAAVLPVATSVVPTMATHGSPRQLPRHFPRKLRRRFPRPSAAIATVTHQFPRNSAEVRGNCHGSFRGRPNAVISTVIRGRPRPSPRKSSYICDTYYFTFRQPFNPNDVTRGHFDRSFVRVRVRVRVSSMVL